MSSLQKTLPTFWPYRSNSEFVDTSGYRFHIQRLNCVRSSTVKSPTVYCLLLHGTGASTHSWAGLMPLLARQFNVVALDLPGHGFTQTPDNADLSITGVAKAIRGLLDQLQIEPELAIGHSAGAAVISELCLSEMLKPDRLISINGAILPLNGVAGMVFSPLARLGAGINFLPGLFARRASDRGQVLRLIKSTGSCLDEPGLQCYQTLLSDPAHVAGVLKLMAAWQLERLAPRLHHLSLPVQLLASDADKTIPLRDAYRLQAILPNASLQVIKGLGHLAHEEDPLRLMSCINQWQMTAASVAEENRIRA